MLALDNHPLPVAVENQIDAAISAVGVSVTLYPWARNASAEATSNWRQVSKSKDGQVVDDVPALCLGGTCGWGFGGEPGR